METVIVPGSEREARAFSRRLEEPTWLADRRAEAFRVWESTDAPARSAHLWRYTDPAVFDPITDPFAGDGGPAFDVNPGPQPGAFWHASLGVAARERPDLVRRWLGSVVGPEHGRYEALAAAAFQGGIVVLVPRNVVVPDPVHLVTRLGDSPFQAGRHLVVVEEGASVTIVDELREGPAGEARFLGVSEVVIGAGASVRYVTLQELASRTRAHLSQTARLGAGAHYSPVLASFGGGLVKTDFGAILEGEGSEVEMTGFLSALGRQKFDHHTTLRHVGRHTRSNLRYQTVLQGRSRSAYTGLIRIEREAAHAEAYQENRNLLLSDHARVDSIPELEILNEEVRCTHGATIGPLDRDQLFYLMSRAVSRPEALRIIIEGHYESALRRLPEGLRERIRSLVHARLQPEVSGG